MARNVVKELVLDSDLSEVGKVERFVMDLQNELAFDEDLFHNLMLALSEAVSNAVMHGNRENPAKQVHLRAWTESDRRLRISVRDEGEGFDPNDVPDPRKKKNLLKSGGRGLYLIRQFAEEVTYTGRGNELILTFLLR